MGKPQDQAQDCDDFVASIGEMINYFVTLRGLPESDGAALAAAVTHELRTRYQGERVTIRKVQQRLHLKKRIAAEFDGTNLAEIIERYGVSRSTVYRYAAARNA